MHANEGTEWRGEKNENWGLGGDIRRHRKEGNKGRFEALLSLCELALHTIWFLIVAICRDWLLFSWDDSQLH